MIARAMIQTVKLRTREWYGNIIMMQNVFQGIAANEI